MVYMDYLKLNLKKLVSIDTTNPPGNESEAVHYLATLFDAEGIEYETFEPLPGRGSIVARIRGTGSARPLMLLGHLDVVTANAADWTHPPFSAAENDSAIWGRGTLDMKGLVATWLTLMVKYKREQAVFPRDIIFAATADEEAGGHLGLGWLVKNRPDLVDCEWALNEGGGNSFTLNGKTFATIQSGEKAGCPVKLLAKGTAGHASIPLPDNPVIKLAEALRSLHEAVFPEHMTDTVRAFLSGLSGGLGGSHGAALNLAVKAGQVGKAVDLAVKDPFLRAGLRAMMQNTAVPTMLSASSKLNVIPKEATAELDCRILPGQSRESLLHELRGVLPADVEIMNERCGEPSESSPNSPLSMIIGDVMKSHLPEAHVIPFLSPGATDARYLRPRGTIVYGFSPMLPGEKVNLAHGVDERISLASLEFGLKVLDDVVSRAARTHR
ncbi:MAG TPA: M20/M25/M40 family metallo-hydrolase [Bacillota bacterium]|nr:M20/M25/M40 family metallo-hydrolase [Bacillota bacterium]